MRTVTLAQYHDLLRTAFDQIAPKDDWKGPIEAVVPWELANLYCQAVVFMTATDANYEFIEGSDMKGLITAPGYNAGPAGG